MKLDLAKISSEKPVVTILTLVAALVAILAGGVVTIVKPESLSFHQYVQDIAFMAGALGLGSGIGRGIDSYGQAVAQAQPQGSPMTTETPPVPPTTTPNAPETPSTMPPEPQTEPAPPPENPPTEPDPEEPGDAAPASPYDTDGPDDEAG